MVPKPTQDIALLKSLSDETRLRLLRELATGERCVCQLFPAVHRTQSTVSIHLRRMEHDDIVASRRDGQKVFYHIIDRRVARILAALRTPRRRVR
jgi:ArsR family transcriptional regulator